MAHNSHRLTLVISWLVFFLLTSPSLPGQARHAGPKKKKPMLTLTNLVSGIKVVFHDPAFISDRSFKDSAWKKMSIYLPGKHQPEVMDANEGTGFRSRCKRAFVGRPTAST